MLQAAMLMIPCIWATRGYCGASKVSHGHTSLSWTMSCFSGEAGQILFATVLVRIPFIYVKKTFCCFCDFKKNIYSWQKSKAMGK